MAETVISFPMFFGDRQEDRALIAELSELGVSKQVAGYIMYRMWKDFAHGKSDRRVVSSSGLSDDRGVKLLEQFCDWEGVPGALVSAAVSSGFLRLESVAGGGNVLICHGFREFNNPKLTSMQSRGGIARALKTHERSAEAAVAERELLWNRTGGGAFASVPEKSRKDAMVLIVMVCRALGRAIPPDSVLTDGTFHLALDIIREHDESSLKDVFMWLLPNRADPVVPDRIDAVLRAWPEFVARAAAAGK